MAAQDIRQQAQELSYILLKVCSYIRKEELSRRIENISYELIQNIYIGNAQEACLNLDGLVGLLALANNTLQISQNNSSILIERCGQLKGNIEIEYNLQEPDQLADAFQRRRLSPTEKPSFTLPKSLQSGSELASRAAKREVALIREALKTNNGKAEAKTEYSNGPAIKRQERIMAILRQAENREMQLRDFVLKIPEVSERTIRYDLEKLVSMGKIERRGSGGPSNYYILAEANKIL